MGDMSAAEPLQQLRLKFLSDLQTRELLTPSMTMSGGGELEVEMIRKVVSAWLVAMGVCDSWYFLNNEGRSHNRWLGRRAPINKGYGDVRAPGVDVRMKPINIKGFSCLTRV